MDGLLRHLNANPNIKTVFFNKEKTEWQFSQSKRKDAKGHRHPVEMTRAQAIKFCGGVEAPADDKKKDDKK